MPLTLTRELRFGLHPSEPTPSRASANGFAGNPVLLDIAPFLTLNATIAGTLNPDTGMLINIKHVDRILRDHAVPALRSAYYTHHIPAPRALVTLFQTLPSHFTPHTLTALRLSLSPYLSYTIHHTEPTMILLTERFEFSAAHRLHSDSLSPEQNLEVFGRCHNSNGHGHNYELEVTIASTPNPATGHILPIPELQQLVNTHILDPFDHKHLNLDCKEFRSPGGLNPTVENIAAVLFNILKPHIPAPARLATLRLWETPKTMAQYSE